MPETRFLRSSGARDLGYSRYVHPQSRHIDTRRYLQPSPELAADRRQNRSVQTLEIHLHTKKQASNQVLKSALVEYARQRRHPLGRDFHSRSSIIFSSDAPLTTASNKKASDRHSNSLLSLA